MLGTHPVQSWFGGSLRRPAVAGVILSLAMLSSCVFPGGERPPEQNTAPVNSVSMEPFALLQQTQAEVEQKNAGCLSCHEGIEFESMHASPAVRLGCVDCHGGNGAMGITAGMTPDSAAYQEVKNQAHVLPRYPERWADADGRYSAANPERTYTLLNRESPEFIRFINPGDLRVAQESCGGCHQFQVNAVNKSPMTTSSIFWAAAGYANGILPTKKAIVGESYSRDGKPQMIKPETPPTEAEKKEGVLSFLLPLPAWQTTQVADNFRAFEDGGLFIGSAFPEIGNPQPLELSGKPDIRVSNRGPGTGVRVSIPILNVQKTRLNDPHLSFMGTNDHPGDYRSSGCT
ncbi:MAG: hypothetical protein ACRERD_21765, partial [Candidatus Binatia bacterium]